MKRLLCLCLCLCICFGLLPVGASAAVAVGPEPLHPQAPVSAIVTLTPDADRDAVIALLDPDEAVTQQYDALLYGFAVSTVQERLEDLRALPGVEAVYRGNTYSYAPLSNQSDYETVLQTISATALNAPAAWDAGYRGQGMVVAVLDTGFYLDHEVFSVHPELLGSVGMSKSHAGSRKDFRQSIRRRQNPCWLQFGQRDCRPAAFSLLSKWYSRYPCGRSGCRLCGR